MINVIIKAIMSAIGALINIPVNPKNLGSISIKGIIIITCLVKDMQKKKLGQTCSLQV